MDPSLDDPQPIEEPFGPIVPSHLSSAPSDPLQHPAPVEAPEPSPSPSPPDEILKCWICFSDSTEDTPTTSQWTTPCPCRLTAHQACLLDWISSLQRENLRNPSQAKKIQCPQCKYPFKISEPFANDPLLRLVRTADKLSNQFLYYGVAAVVAGGLYSSALIYGLAAVQVVFGRTAAGEILRVDRGEGLPVLAFLRDVSRGSRDALWKKAELLAGLPCIPIALILARTSWAKYKTPLLPLFVLIPRLRRFRERTASGRVTFSWPPDPEGVFAMLPYVVEAYDKLWEVYINPFEKAWDEELQMRRGSDEEERRLEAENERRAGHANNDDSDDDEMDGEDGEIEFVVEIEEEGSVLDEAGDPIAEAPLEIEPSTTNDGDTNATTGSDPTTPGIATPTSAILDEVAGPQAVEAATDEPAPQEVPLASAAEAAQAARAMAELQAAAAEIRPRADVAHNAPDLPPAVQARVETIIHEALAQQRRANGAARANRYNFSLDAVMQTVLGALALPIISALAGGALTYLLPRSWTSTSAPSNMWWRAFGGARGEVKPGLLGLRWGRAVAGGCMVVVLKDSVRLWGKWRDVQQGRRRTVEDYKGEKYYKAEEGRVVDPRDKSQSEEQEQTAETGAAGA